MPITKSAQKALRQNQKRKTRNLIYKNKVKELIKQIRFFASGNKIEEAKKLLPQVYKAIDKTAKINVIKKNTASRLKSRLSKLINKNLKSQ